MSGSSHNVYGHIEGVGMNTPSAHAAGSSTTIELHQILNFGDTAGETYYFGMWKWGAASSTSDWLGEPSGSTYTKTGWGALGYLP